MGGEKQNGWSKKEESYEGDRKSERGGARRLKKGNGKWNEGREQEERYTKEAESRQEVTTDDEIKNGREKVKLAFPQKTNEAGIRQIIRQEAQSENTGKKGRRREETGRKAEAGDKRRRNETSKRG